MDIVNSFVAWGFSIFSLSNSVRDNNEPILIKRDEQKVNPSNKTENTTHTHKVYSSVKALEHHHGWKLPNGVIAMEFVDIKKEPCSKWDDLKYEGTIDYKNTKMVYAEPTTKEGKENEKRKSRWMRIDSEAEEEHIAPYENRRNLY